MRICRFKLLNNTPRFGLVEGERFCAAEGETIDRSLMHLPARAWRFLRRSCSGPLQRFVCVGRNYREHAAELGNKMPDEPCFSEGAFR